MSSECLHIFEMRCRSGVVLCIISAGKIGGKNLLLEPTPLCSVFSTKRKVGNYTTILGNLVRRGILVHQKLAIHMKSLPMVSSLQLRTRTLREEESARREPEIETRLEIETRTCAQVRMLFGSATKALPVFHVSQRSHLK